MVQDFVVLTSDVKRYEAVAESSKNAMKRFALYSI